MRPRGMRTGKSVEQSHRIPGRDQSAGDRHRPGRVHRLRRDPRRQEPRRPDQPAPARPPRSPTHELCGPGGGQRLPLRPGTDSSSSPSPRPTAPCSGPMTGPGATHGPKPTGLAVTVSPHDGRYSLRPRRLSLANMRALPSSVFTRNGVRLKIWFNETGPSASSTSAPGDRSVILVKVATPWPGWATNSLTARELSSARSARGRPLGSGRRRLRAFPVFDFRTRRADALLHDPLARSRPVTRPPAYPTGSASTPPSG